MFIQYTVFIVNTPHIFCWDRMHGHKLIFLRVYGIIIKKYSLESPDYFPLKIHIVIILDFTLNFVLNGDFITYNFLFKFYDFLLDFIWGGDQIGMGLKPYYKKVSFLF